VALRLIGHFNIGVSFFRFAFNYKFGRLRKEDAPRGEEE
jgi:hypothetical protein